MASSKSSEKETITNLSVESKFGFAGVTLANQQSGGAKNASNTYGTTEQDMLQKVYNALRTFGFLS